MKKYILKVVNKEKIRNEITRERTKIKDILTLRRPGFHPTWKEEVGQMTCQMLIFFAN